MIQRNISVVSLLLIPLILCAAMFSAVAAEPVRPKKAGGGKIVGGGERTTPTAKSAVSASPRVTPDVLNRYSRDAADAWGVVIEGKPGPRAFNYQVQLAVTLKGTWIACWTQGTTEAAPDQRVVVSRSLDRGRSWSSEIAVEEAGQDYRVPAWGIPFVVPNTGRVYIFYWYNYNGVRLRDAGDIFFRFSDDDGVHWSPRHRIGIPRTNMDRDELGDMHGWNFGQPKILPNGRVMFTYTKIRRSSLCPNGWRLMTDNRWTPDDSVKVDPTKPPTHDGGDPNAWVTEVFFVELPNILTQQDPTKLEFRFLPKGGSGLWAPYPETDRHFGQEGTLAPLSGGRLLCVLRTRQGRPYYTVSSDRGETWTKPEPLCLRPGGEAFNQPCSPCPITWLPDGRLVLVFHNARPIEWGWHPRDPLWISVGRESPDVKENAGLSFTKPKVLIYNDGKRDGPFQDFEICYPAFYQFSGRYYVAYSNKTSQIRINEIPAPLLDDSELVGHRTR